MTTKPILHLNWPGEERFRRRQAMTPEQHEKRRDLENEIENERQYRNENGQPTGGNDE